MKEFGLSVQDVQTISKYPSSLAVYKQVAASRDSQLVFRWIFEHILGNCRKKDLDFEKTLHSQFNAKQLGSLIDVAENNHQITMNNSKRIMYELIDGRSEDPYDIAKEMGFVEGEV
jgi:Asp-tRNA(Asn)/Glu-tRNA(Gln) amidotransferase B subunit